MSSLVLYTASYPYGKKETYLETEIKYLSDGFDEIHIFPLYYNEGDLSQRKVPENVKVHQAPVPISKISRLAKFFASLVINFSLLILFYKDYIGQPGWLSLGNLKRSVFDFIDYIVLAGSKQLKDSQDIKASSYYFYWSTGWGLTLSFCKKNRDSRYFVRVHGGDVFLERNSGYLPLRRKVFNSSDNVLCCSLVLVNYIKNVYEIGSERLVLSRLGVTPVGDGKFDPLQETITVVSSSNVIGLKRLDKIVSALKMINDHHVEWVHFGDGELLDEIKSSTIDLPENVSVRFMGRVENAEIHRFYTKNHVDVFVNVSDHEGVPVSVMEAMAYEIPVFATDVGATREIVDDDNGIIVPADFPVDVLASAICKSKSWTEKRKASYRKWRKLCSAEESYGALVNLLTGKQL